MRIDRAWIEPEWRDLIAEADLDATRTQLLVVEEQQPDDTAECAYCSPSMGPPLAPRTHAVITRVHPDLLARSHHIFAVWRDLPEADEVLVSGLLRHELEHARQWERYGPQVMDELDAELKLVAEATGRSYHAVPCERAADYAARRWVQVRHGDRELERVKDAMPHWRDLPASVQDTDLRAASVAALEEWAPNGYEVEMSNAAPVSVSEFIRMNSTPWPGLQANPRDDGEVVEFVAPWQPG